MCDNVLDKGTKKRPHPRVRWNARSKPDKAFIRIPASAEDAPSGGFVLLLLAQLAVALPASAALGHAKPVPRDSKHGVKIRPVLSNLRGVATGLV